MAFLNRCIWTAASSGTVDFVVSAAAQNGYVPSGCLNPAVVDGATYHYFATNGTEHEEGDGAYTVSTTTLARTTIRNSSNSGAKVNFSAAPVVIMGGQVAGWLGGQGNYSSTQAATPTTALTPALAGLGAGNVDNGTHYYVVQFITKAGHTTSGPTSAGVAVVDKTANGQVSLTAIPTGPSGTIARDIFRSVANTGLFGQFPLHKFLTRIADNTTTTFIDNVADASLGNAESPINTTDGAIIDTTLGAVAGYDNDPQGYNAGNPGQFSARSINYSRDEYGAYFLQEMLDVTAGGSYVEYRTTGGFAAQFQATNFVDAALPSTQSYFYYTTFNFARGFGPLENEIIFSVDMDYAISGGQPGFVITSGGANQVGGVPIDGQKVGVNVNQPVAILDVANVSTANGTTKPVSRFSGVAGQTADLAQWTNSSLTVLAKINSAGVLTSQAVNLPETDKGTVSSGTCTFDASVAAKQKVTNGGAFTIAYSNWPASGTYGEVEVELVNGAAHTITWPTVNWLKGDGTSTTTFSANGVTLQTTGTNWVVVWSTDGGSTLWGRAA